MTDFFFWIEKDSQLFKTIIGKYNFFFFFLYFVFCLCKQFWNENLVFGDILEKDFNIKRVYIDLKTKVDIFVALFACGWWDVY